MSMEFTWVVVLLVTLVGYQVDQPGPAPHHWPSITATAGRFEPDRQTLAREPGHEPWPDYCAPYERIQTANVADAGWAVAVSVPLREGWAAEAGIAGSGVENRIVDLVESSGSCNPDGDPVEVNHRQTSLRFAHVGPSRSIRLGERVRVTGRIGAGLAWVDTRDDWPWRPWLSLVGGDGTESRHPLLLLGADVAVRPFPGVEAVLDVREMIHECDSVCTETTDRLDHTVVSAGLRIGMP